MPTTRPWPRLRRTRHTAHAAASASSAARASWGATRPRTDGKSPAGPRARPGRRAFGRGGEVRRCRVWFGRRVRGAPQGLPCRGCGGREVTSKGPPAPAGRHDETRFGWGKPRRASGGMRSATTGSRNGLPSGRRPRSRRRPRTSATAGGHGLAATRGTAAGGGERSGGYRHRRESEEATTGTSGSARKPDEPQGRQQDATSLRAVGGASRQGGENPRRRNERSVWQRLAEAGPRSCGSGHRW